jgi:hypothetical protein
MTNPLDIARSIFSMQINRCKEADDEIFLLELKRLVALVEGNSHLQRCISDIIFDANKWYNSYQEKEEEARRRIIKLRDELIALSPTLENEEEKGDIPELNPTIIYFNKLLSGERKPGIPLMPDPADDQSLNSKLLNIIMRIASRHFGKTENIPDTFYKSTLYEEDQLEWLRNELRNFVRDNPGSIWSQVISATQEINPLPKHPDVPIDINDLMFKAIHGLRFKKILYGWESKYSNVAPSEDERKHYKSWKARITKGLALLNNELVIRLATRASSEWAVRNYAARTSIYRYDEIRQSIEQQKKSREVKGKKRNKVESFLMDDAAAYLFDKGFGVITERHLASGRLDIYEEIMGVEVARDALLIETKIYEKPSDGKTALKNGLSQLYGYATSIESSFHPTENFLLIYRLSGPKLIFPREAIEMGEYTIKIIHIDLSPPEESGSRSPKPITIDIKKIVPEVLSEFEQKQKHRNSRIRTEKKKKA